MFEKYSGGKGNTLYPQSVPAKDKGEVNDLGYRQTRQHCSRGR